MARPGWRRILVTGRTAGAASPIKVQMACHNRAHHAPGRPVLEQWPPSRITHRVESPQIAQSCWLEHRVRDGSRQTPRTPLLAVLGRGVTSTSATSRMESARMSCLTVAVSRFFRAMATCREPRALPHFGLRSASSPHILPRCRPHPYRRSRIEGTGASIPG